MTANQKYVLVVSSFTKTITGDVAFTITGDGAVAVRPNANSSDALAASTAAKTPTAEANKVMLTISTPAQTGHTIYYRTVSSDPSALAPGAAFNSSGWTMNSTGTSAFEITATDGHYVEVVEVNGATVTRWGKTGPVDDGYTAPVAASGLSASAAAKTPTAQENKVMLTISTAAQASHKIYYKVVSADPTAPNVGIAFSATGWTQNTSGTAAFEITATDGQYVEVVEVKDADTTITRWGKTGPVDDGYTAPTAASGLSAGAAAKTPTAQENKVMLTISTAAQASHKIYYKVVSADPTAPNVGTAFTATGWTENTSGTSAFEITATDGQYVEVVEVKDADTTITRWGKTGPVDDGYTAPTAASGLSAGAAAKTPTAQENKVMLTISTAAQASHKIYYKVVSADPTAPNVGTAFTATGWTENTSGTSAFEITATDGQYVEVVEVKDADTTITRWGKTGPVDDGYTAPTAASGLSAGAAAKTPTAQENKVMLTISTAAQASHKIYYKVVSADPTAPNVGTAFTATGWTENTSGTSAFEITATDGQYVEVVEVKDADTTITRWGKTGPVDDGYTAPTAASGLSASAAAKTPTAQENKVMLTISTAAQASHKIYYKVVSADPTAPNVGTAFTATGWTENTSGTSAFEITATDGQYVEVVEVKDADTTITRWGKTGPVDDGYTAPTAASGLSAGAAAKTPTAQENKVMLTISTAAQASHKIYYKVVSADPTAPNVGTAFTATGWTENTSGTAAFEITATDGQYVEVVEVKDADTTITRWGKTGPVDDGYTAAPTYMISAIAAQTLEPLTVGYLNGTQQTKTVTISRTGTGVLNNLAVALEGAGAGDFTLGTLSATTLDDGQPTATFTVKAVDGLAQGTHSATVRVTANNMTAVTFTVTQVVNHNVDLSGLSLSNGTLSPVFSRSVIDYDVSVANNVQEVTVTPTAAHQDATIKVNGVSVASGVPSSPIQLTVGNNTIRVVVSAQNDSKTYTVTVARAEADFLEIAKRDLAIGFWPGDATHPADLWNNVTRNITLLTTGSNGAQISWSSSNLNYISPNGTVQRPASGSGDATVTMTATLNLGVRTVRKTFFLVVKPLDQAITGTPVERTVDVKTGEDGVKAAEVAVYRTVEGTKKVDTVALNEEKAAESVQEALQQNRREVHIDLASDAQARDADAFNVQVHRDAITRLGANQMTLQIASPDVKVTIPQESVQTLTNDGIDLYFRVVPIKQAPQVAQQTQAAKNNATVMQVTGASGDQIQLVGKPMTIETNLSNRRTKVTFPLPSDLPASQLASLRVWVQHTDGTEEVKTGTIEYNNQGRPVGITIEIDKFSVFTIVRAEVPSGGGGGGSDGDGTVVTPVKKPDEPTKPVEHTVKQTIQPYVFGYPDRTFKPEKPITRGELAVIIDRQLASAEEIIVIKYPDVPSEHWAFGAIQRLQSMRLIQGYPDGSFRPDQYVTRAELSALVTKWKKLSNEGRISFSDVQGHWAEQSVATMEAANILHGYPDGLFRPDQAVTRAEIVVLMNNLIGRKPLTGLSKTTWSDVSGEHWAAGAIEAASTTYTIEVKVENEKP
ncbi:hypothetical protein GTO91_07490 [Heliobacterium undosum]|uniref:SLH domain-containing protein n=1 Tax=Heliomicrobium undosum TaxID=121734 RepID=A0A845KZM8_9FIRM|nr:S-layer homology domain-containing protein [Heliomicrobium undosum]MZP29547.1 hypothetical protein [Heliomicrobium undosum]